MTSACDKSLGSSCSYSAIYGVSPDKGLLSEDQGHEHIIGYTDVDRADHHLTKVQHPDIVF